MDIRRMIAVIVVAAVLAAGTVTPSPARADDTTDNFIYAGIALAAYAGIVVLATAIIYRTPSELALTPADVDVRRDIPEPAVRVGRHCRQSATTLTLLCW
jgi:hypothetical protein